MGGRARPRTRGRAGHGAWLGVPVCRVRGCRAAATAVHAEVSTLPTDTVLSICIYLFEPTVQLFELLGQQATSPGKSDTPAIRS